MSRLRVRDVLLTLVIIALGLGLAVVAALIGG